MVAFLIGCAVLLLGVGCSGTRPAAPQEEKKQQGHTEATTTEQGHSGEAASEGESRCDGTRPFQKWGYHFTTNDLPDCPTGGLLLGTDERDKLGGREGDDEIRGLGAKDQLFGGVGKDFIYGGPGDDSLLVGDDGDDVIYGDAGDDGISGGPGADVLYGGDGNDSIENDGAGGDGQPDKLYCGEGKDRYSAEKHDYVSSSCEKKIKYKAIP